MDDLSPCLLLPRLLLPQLHMNFPACHLTVVSSHSYKGEDVRYIRTPLLASNSNFIPSGLTEKEKKVKKSPQ